MARRVVPVAIGWGVVCALLNWWPVISTLGQMAVPWVWLAAWAGSLAGRRGAAAVTGGAALITATLAYFGVTYVSEIVAYVSVAGGYRLAVLWTAVSLVVGPIAGAVGHLVRNDRRRPFAVTAIAVISVAEPVALWAHIDHLDAHVTYVLVGIVGMSIVPALLRPPARTAALAAAMALIGVYPLAVGVELLLIALGQVSGPMRLL